MTEMRQPQSGPFLSLLPSLCRISSGWICWWSSNKQTNKMTGLCIILIFKWKCLSFTPLWCTENEFIKAIQWSNLSGRIQHQQSALWAWIRQPVLLFLLPLTDRKEFYRVHQRCSKHSWLEEKKNVNKKRFPKISRRQCTTLGTL